MTTEDHAPDVKRYLMVFAALLFLTVVTVAVSYLKLPIHLAVILGVFIATVKASLVALFFMHLSNERVIIYWFLGVTVSISTASEYRHMQTKQKRDRG